MIYLVTNQQRLFNLSNSIQFASVETLLNYFEKETEIQLDTETEGFDVFTKKLLTLQLGDCRGEHQFVVDLTTVNVLLFKNLLEDPTKLFVLQNAKFDLRFFYYHKITIANVWDTYLAEALLYQGDKKARKALDYLVYKYCKQTLDKSIRGDIHRQGLSESVIVYAAKDTLYLSEIKRKQTIKLIEEDLIKAMQLENLFVRVLAYIEFSGFKLDTDKWKEKMKQDEKLLHLKKLALDEWLYNSNLEEYKDNQLSLFEENEKKVNIEWSSPKQVVALFKKLGISTVNKEGKDSVDAKVISPQKNKSTIIPIYLEYKAAEKVVSTYGQSVLKMVNPVTKRIHTQFQQLMDTGRLSCGGKNKSTGEEYINLQNIPAVPEFREEGRIYARECFLPEEGYNFIVSDYSSQESVVFANKCLDKGLLDFYDSGFGDMHSYVAKLCYPEILKEVPLEQVKKVRKDLRQNAKAAGFSLQFGGVGATIANNLGIPLEEGNAVEEAYYLAFPGVKKYFKKVTEEALATGKVIFNNVTKHRVIFPMYEEYLKLKETTSKPGFWDSYRENKVNQTNSFFDYYKPLVSDMFKIKGEIERKAKNFPKIWGNKNFC